MSTIARTHYEILGIARDSDASEIRRAWRILVQVWHPDRFDGNMREEAERATADINAAYHALRDSSRRAAYDCKLAAESRTENAGTADRRGGTDTTGSTARPTGAGVRTGTTMHTPGPATSARRASASGRASGIPPETTFDLAARTSQELVDSLRRNPRMLAGVGIGAALLVATAMFVGSLFGPSLPAGAELAVDSSLPPVARAEDMPAFDDLIDDAEPAPDADVHEIGRGLTRPPAMLGRRDPRRPPAPDATARRQPLTRTAPAPTARPPARGTRAPRVIRTTRNGRDVLRVLPAGSAPPGAL